MAHVHEYKLNKVEQIVINSLLNLKKKEPFRSLGQGTPQSKQVVHNNCSRPRRNASSSPRFTVLESCGRLKVKVCSLSMSCHVLPCAMSCLVLSPSCSTTCNIEMSTVQYQSPGPPNLTTTPKNVQETHGHSWHIEGGKSSSRPHASYPLLWYWTPREKSF